MLDLVLCALLAGPAGPAPCPSPPREGEGSRRQTRPSERLVDEIWTADGFEQVVAGILTEIETIRGKRFVTPVSVRLTDRETIRQRTRERYRTHFSSSEFLAEEISAKLLGLIPGDLDLETAVMELLDEQFGWFYEPADAIFHLATDYTIGQAQLALVRGLTRILDDQHYELRRTAETLTRNTDALLAMEAVASGSASALEATWRARHGHALSERERESWPTALDPLDLEDTPAYLWKPMVAFALRGYTFLQRSSVVSVMLQSARVDDIDRALRELPISTEQVLHPVKYWKKSREDLPRTIEFDLAGLPAGWTVLREDTLGELYMGMLVEPDAGLETSRARPGSFAGTRYTCEASEGWGGDRFVLLQGPSGYLLHMVTVWDAIADASEFYNAVQRLRPQLLQNLAELPGAHAESERGLLVGFGATHDQVHYTAWVGVDEDDVAALVSRLTYTVAG